MSISIRKIALSILLVFQFILIGKVSFSQSNSMQSIIVDPSFEPIGGAYIKNLRTNDFVISDKSGHFRIPCNTRDSLIVTAMGYEIKKVFFAESKAPFIQLEQITYTLKQVNVYDFKGWESFKKEFLAIELPEQKVNTKGLPAGKPYSKKPMHLRSNTFESKPGPIHFIVSPFSSLAYYINKEEKAKREVWRRMLLEKKESTYWSVMHMDSLRLWFDVPDSLLDDFIVFCNDTIENKGGSIEYNHKEKLLNLYPVFLERRLKKE